jgi:hypothetical protein
VEAWSTVNDSRIAEIVWMIVIAIVVAAGGNIVLGLLAVHRWFATVALAVVVVVALLAVRRALAANAPSARLEVSKAATYLVAAILAFVAIGLHVHWAIGACIAATEAAIVFDIVTIAARPKPAPGEEIP